MEGGASTSYNALAMVGSERQDDVRYRCDAFLQIRADGTLPAEGDVVRHGEIEANATKRRKFRIPADASASLLGPGGDQDDALPTNRTSTQPLLSPLAHCAASTVLVPAAVALVSVESPPIAPTFMSGTRGSASGLSQSHALGSIGQ